MAQAKLVAVGLVSMLAAVGGAAAFEPEAGERGRIERGLGLAMEDTASARAAADYMDVRFAEDGARFGILVSYDMLPGMADVARLRRAGATNVEAFHLVPVARVGPVDAATVHRIAQLPGVARVEGDLLMRPLLDVSAAAVKARDSATYPQAAWNALNVTGDGIAIALLDTGVDDEHTMLAGKYQAGFDATLPTPSSLPILRALLAERNPDDDDVTTHGTHTAGIALGGTTTSNLAGTAPGATLVDVKVLPGSAPGLSSYVVRGLEWLVDYNAGLTGYGTPPIPVRVASLSVGGYPFGADEDNPPDGSDSASEAINAAFDAGILSVVAVGNCGPFGDSDCPYRGGNSVAVPAVALRSVAVGAVDDAATVARGDDIVAGYSSRGPNGAEPKPNLVAPGNQIRSASGSLFPVFGDPGGFTSTQSGTSMAAPHVAGIAALVLEAHPDLSPVELKARLLETAEDRGTVGWDPDHGSGYVDALGAAS